MKTGILIAAFILLGYVLQAQPPQKFNYQAVARNSSGNVLAEQSLTVKIGVLQNSVLVWQEEHAVETNPQGHFTLQVGGPEAVNGSGSAESFGDIDWSSGLYEMSVEIDAGNGFISMGTSEMVSVPFALHATNGPIGPQGPAGPKGDKGDPATDDQSLSLTGTTLTITGGNEVDLVSLVDDADNDPANELQDLTFVDGVISLSQDPDNTAINIDNRIAAVSGWELDEDNVFTAQPVEILTNTNQTDTPLFEVRNDAGNPVFAVFNDGVMVYVDEEKKGVKGGFAVGGYNSASKGVTQEYLRITPDSVRIYVPDDPSTKGVKGGFAVGGYNTASKGPTFNFLEVSSKETSILFDTTNQEKGIKGGFAVGGYNPSSKASTSQLMSLTPENYLIGQDAGASITEGLYNSFIGYQSGISNTTGSENIFIGRFSGYSNIGAIENTFIGNSSGYNTSSGYGNVYIGNQAGFQSVTGYYNSFVGYQAGYNNTSYLNTFFGYQAGYNNTSGRNNLGMGYQAGFGHQNGITGSNNVFLGTRTGYQTTSGSNNVFLGNLAGNSNEGGSNNVFMGTFSGRLNVDGGRNVFVGNEAGYSNTSGYDNVFIGNAAGRSNIDGIANVFIGQNAGHSNQYGDYNTFIGYQAGNNLTGGTNNWEGAYNTILGYQAGHDILKGYKNVLIGYQAGYKIRDNRYNIIIGEGAGYNLEGELGNEFSGQANLLMGLFAGSALTTGSSNIFLGLDVGYNCAPDAIDNVWIGLSAGRSSASSGSVFLGKYAGYNEDADNKLIIQTGYTGSDNLNNALIYGDFVTKDLRFNATIGINRNDNSSYGLVVDGGTSTNYSMLVYKGAYAYSNGFVSASDLTLKKDINTIQNALGLVTSLRGVTYRWKETEAIPENGREQIGLIAQEVEAVLPQIVTENDEGHKGVSYDKLSAVLIEAMKEQQMQIEQLQSEVDRLKKLVE
ncbi:MAG: tail fiber domain-containing protein [Bacteroidales bacterium]